MKAEHAALAQAKQTLAAKGKTFNWARRLLNPTHGNRAARLYAFCRYLDDLADEAASPTEAHTRLQAVDTALQSGGSTDPKVADALLLFRECGIDAAIPRELIKGLLDDLSAVRIRDEAELLRYCYRVAGTVGLMMCDVLDVKNPSASAFAIDLGIAMQLTNICRDVYEDAQLGRRYLPASLVGDLDAAALLTASPSTQASTQKAVRHLLQLADRYYASGEQGLPYLPLRARHGIRVAGRLYRAIGGQIQAQDCNVWAGRARVGLSQKIALTLSSVIFGGFSPSFLRVSSSHNASLHRALRGLPRNGAPKESDYDVIILGAGCSGLSFALRLATLGAACPKILLIEQRSSYLNDRTWCYWSQPGASLTHLARHTWNTVTVAHNQQRVIYPVDATPYQAVASDAFYTAAFAALAKNPNIELRLSTSVSEEATDCDGRWKVQTPRETVQSRQIIDTRPWRKGPLAQPLLAQSFSGVEITSEAELFTPDNATLMEFIDGPAGQLTFLYILPYSTRQALIEVTVFSPHAQSAQDLAPLLEAQLKRLTRGHAYQVNHRESYVIPMGLPDDVTPPTPSYVRVGLESGGVRAATGYGFQRIQQWATQAADQLLRGLPIQPHAPDPWMIRWMDSLFLRVLRAAPEEGPDIFLRLFSRVPSGPLLRFLSGRARFTDCLKVARALPAKLFLRQLIKGDRI